MIIIFQKEKERRGEMGIGKSREKGNKEGGREMNSTQ